MSNLIGNSETGLHQINVLKEIRSIDSAYISAIKASGTDARIEWTVSQ